MRMLEKWNCALWYSNSDCSPALQIKSIISEIREIEAGESVGYNGTFVAEKKSIAAVPVGF